MSKESELSLKVMRLSKPTLHSGPAVYSESLNTDAHKAWEHAVGSDIANSAALFDQPSADFSISHLFGLPSSFGNIYLGETFNAYLSINNETNALVVDVGIKAEIQTSSQRFILVDTLGPSAPGSLAGSATNLNQVRNVPLGPKTSLSAQASNEYVLSHEIKELGTHILVCSVQYNFQGEKKQFRKFFKFQVLNPLAVKTKVNNLQDGRIMLEAQIQNTTTGYVIIEKLEFMPFELFGFNDLTETCFEGMPVLDVKDTRQYLFMLYPLNQNDSRSTPTLGKLDISWRTAMGQVGRLQTSALTRKQTLSDPFDLFVTEIPQKIQAEEPFKLKCRVVNYTNESVRLSMSSIKAKMSSILLSGFSERAIGLVGAYATTELVLDLFPLYSGVHKVSGLKIVDVISGSSKDVDNLIDLVVN